MGTLASLAVFRIFVPVARSLRHRLRVVEVRAGQFFVWRFRQPGLRWEGHPYSLSAAPDGQRLRITVRNLGDSSGRPVGAAAGARAFAEGPYGMFTTRASTQPYAVLIGAGIGVTPVCALLEEMAGTADRVTVILRADEDVQLYLRSDFERLSKRGNVTLHVITGLPPVGKASWLSASLSSRDPV